MKREFFECKCYNLDCTLVVTNDQDDEFENLYFELVLRYAPWYKRIWYALKYIFKSTPIGFYDIIIQDKDIDKLVQTIKESKKVRNQPS